MLLTITYFLPSSTSQAIDNFLRLLLVLVALVAIVTATAAFGAVVVALVSKLVLPTLLIAVYGWVTYPRREVTA